MFKCYNCGMIFNEPKEYIEPDGLDFPPYRTTGACPFCHSDDYQPELYNCDYCGEPIFTGEKHYITRSLERLCTDCVEEKE